MGSLYLEEHSRRGNEYNLCNGGVAIATKFSIMGVVAERLSSSEIVTICSEQPNLSSKLGLL